MQTKDEFNIYCKSQHQVPFYIKQLYLASGFKKLSLSTS